MERKQLSADLLIDKVVIGIILIVFSAVFFNRSVVWWGEALVIFVLLFFAFSIFYLPDTIEFDDNNMYIERRSGEITVDLRDIYTVKLTGFRLNHRHMWKVKYRENGIEKAARFYPNYSLTTLDEFTTQVKSKNPDAECIYSSGIFDFDM